MTRVEPFADLALKRVQLLCTGLCAVPFGFQQVGGGAMLERAVDLLCATSESARASICQALNSAVRSRSK
jgi:hypothetical protein